MSEPSPFSAEEVAAFHAKRKQEQPQTYVDASDKLTCVHCSQEFPRWQGNADAPLCDHCLHSD